jgi:hypothetical protein
VERKILYDIFYYYYNINNSNNNNNKQMNKTKKDKYLRKNRGNKRGKHKTRKVQRGGEVNQVVLLRLQQDADNRNKMNQESLPMFKELIRKFRAWVIKKFTPGTIDQMKEIEQLSKLEESISTSEKNKNLDENIENSINTFKQILLDILNKRIDKLQKFNSNILNKNENVESAQLENTIKEIKTMLDELKKIDNNNFTEDGITNHDIKGKINNAKKLLEQNTGKPTPSTKNSKEIELSELSELSELPKELPKELSKELPKKLPKELPNLDPSNAVKKLDEIQPPQVPPETTPNTAPNTTQEMDPLSSNIPVQVAGGKTRKSQQYIREIKQNRTELFNKEMEIINSIRNFKHGHNKDSKKRFMKAVKRA